MHLEIGTFVWVKFPFIDDENRYKVRPVMVVARHEMPNGEVVCLGVGKYSSIDRVRGSAEVVLSKEDALAVGLDKDGVLRFSRDSRIAFPECDVRSVAGCYKNLSALKQEAIRRAAKAIGVSM